VTTWKKQFVARVAELFADRRQRRTEQAMERQELSQMTATLWENPQKNVLYS